ncbi:MAG TPA: SurA N-terminal domain-containing protein, partial [Thermodesulfobacteriota bacterium]
MKNRSRKRLARIAAALLVLNIAGCGVLKDNSKEVIIRVNGRSITAGEYGDALKSLVPTARGHEADELVELKKELVTEMVEEELLLEEAQAAGITVSPEELSSEVDMIRQEYGESPFRAVIEER